MHSISSRSYIHKRKSRLNQLSLAVSLGLLSMSALGRGAAPIPEIKPVPDNGNLPLTSAMFSGSTDYGDLARYGYVEEEFYMSGRASVRSQETGAIEMADLPYTTRLLIRRPINPTNFSGNVVLEPFHAVLEKNDMWRQTHGYITRHGDVWVGLTIKPYTRDMDPTGPYIVGGIPMLKAYDAERYGPLNLQADNRTDLQQPPLQLPLQGFDLIAQAGALLKSNAPNSPLKNLRVKKLIAMGSGVPGETLEGFIRTGMDEEQRLANDGVIIDGYLLGAVNRFPVKPPKDAAFAMFRSENELERSSVFGFIGKNPDLPSYRIYDVPGSAHLSAGNRPDGTGSLRQLNAVLPKPELNMPYVIENYVCPNINDDPFGMFLTAILNRLELWSNAGTPLPAGPPSATLPGDVGAVMGNLTGAGTPTGNPAGEGMPNKPLRMSVLKRDPVSGNILGGVRLPWVEVPIAQYVGPRPSPGTLLKETGAPSVIKPSDAWPRATKEAAKLPIKNGPAPCGVFNPRIPYDTATLRKLYRNYDDYVRKFEQAKAAAVKAGYILAEDAATLRPRGNPADF